MHRETKIPVGLVFFLVWILVTSCENQKLILLESEMVNGFLFHDSLDHRVITYTRIVKTVIITAYSQKEKEMER